MSPTKPNRTMLALVFALLLATHSVAGEAYDERLKETMDAALARVVKSERFQELSTQWFSGTYQNADPCRLALAPNTDFPFPPAADADASLKLVLDTGKLRVGVVGISLAPFIVYASDNSTEPTGFEADFMDELVNEIAENYAQPVTRKAVYVPLVEDYFNSMRNSLYGVGAATTDVLMTAMSFRTDRAERVEFTCSYATVKIGSVVDASHTGVQQISDLNSASYRIAVMDGTTNHDYAVSNLPLASLNVVPSVQAQFDALTSGNADAVLGDSPNLAVFINEEEDCNCRLLQDFVGEDDNYVMAVKKTEAVDAALGVAPSVLALLSVLASLLLLL